MGTRFLFLQLQVSAAVILILILRQGMRRLPKIYSYVLWIMVFGRLLCPVSLESQIGFMPSWQEGIHWIEGMYYEGAGEETFPGQENGTENSKETGDKGNQGKSGESGSGIGSGMAPAGSESGMSALGQGPEEAQEAKKDRFPIDSDRAEGLWTLLRRFFGEKESWFRILLFLFWAAGLAAVLGYNAKALARVRKKLRNAVKLEGAGEILSVKGGKNAFLGQNVYRCEGISVPFTMGAFRPRIYLPKGIEGAELKYILCHEGVHAGRRDNLVKSTAFLLTAVNWFNPFVWAAFRFMERDMEMSCDEKVVRLMGSGIKKKYSQSLLDFAVERGQMAMTPLTFGENDVKNRIKNILSYKSAKKWSVVLGIVIIFGVGALLFTSRAEGAERSGFAEGRLEGENLEKDGFNGSNRNESNLSNGNRNGSGLDGSSLNGSESDGSEEGQVYWSGNLTAYGEDQTPEDVAVEIRAEGIYRRDGDLWNCLYSGYVSPNVRWCDKDGILYFTMDADYEGGDGEYLADRIYRMDLRTGELDGETLRLRGQVKEEDIHALNVGEGFVTLYRNEKDIIIPLVNTESTSLAGGHTWEGKAVAELDEEERNAYGTAVREHLLSRPGLLLELSNRSLEETFAVLDLDGDGKAERIVLSADPGESGYYPYDACRLQVGDSVLTGKAENLSNFIWAFCMDESRIILALYSDGGGLRSRTILFAYEDKELKELGSIPDDIRYCVIEEGKIEGCSVLYDTMMPLYLKVSYRINQDNVLEQVSQEAYELMGADGRLLQDLPVHDEPEGEEVHTMTPQMVQFVKIDSAYEWICLKGENGDEGWFKVEGEMRDRISELDKDSSEVFEFYYAG